MLTSVRDPTQGFTSRVPPWRDPVPRRRGGPRFRRTVGLGLRSVGLNVSLRGAVASVGTNGVEVVEGLGQWHRVSRPRSG